MTGLLNNQPPKFTAKPGLTFEANFRYGANCVVARPEAPMLRFPDSMPLEFVRDTIESWTAELQGGIPGTGYYAFSQAEEVENPGFHVLVLFADDGFFSNFLGSVRSGNLPPVNGGSIYQRPDG